MTLTTEHLTSATMAAEQAYPAYRSTSPQQRADFLATVADEIEADGDEIIKHAVAESGLPEGRITGELGRTTGQLRMFAEVVRRGEHLGARIDPAQPNRQPLPRADIRQRQVPLGPVAVFGASNFPLAFSTAGGDTASALAAGCPVVVKGHPAHPETGALVARAVSRAVAACDLPPGVFSFVLGEGNETGQALVRDPRIKAVGFTGSRQGGLALVAAAATREVPIPVYAEMSSINPVVVLPGALGEDVADLASAYVGSLTLGSGQFCTNPGLLFLPTGPEGDAFLEEAATAVRASIGQTMLTTGIAAAYANGSDRLAESAGTRVLAEGTPGDGQVAPAPRLVEADAAALGAPDSVVVQEVFGASGVVVRYQSVDELVVHLTALEGQLTATVHCTAADTEDARALLPLLEEKAGRVLFNGWPTGVEVGHAMVHGGPHPATSDSRTTSVGSLAIERFQRPVCYQDVPDGLLPEPVQDANPWGLLRRVDGVLTPP